ncbi:MAG TPA: nucleotidyltransferase domain-containing protein [Spirochaetota bacterium]|nr:nucleotidyltransferase domain-containing protein [Spirochaetota bacterium]HPQ55198.1 nucleotidyltransferase domain-containing protein [Spirochaetota bacterium]HQO02628.1 nucleotidyltransferase domain-containing protein [Spirochaetota bacterium]
MRRIIEKNLQTIRKILTENRVKQAYLFGSSSGTGYTGDSDVDIVISFEENLDPLVRGEMWWNIYFGLEDVLKLPIDLIAADTVHNPYLKKSIEESKVPLL